VTTPSCCVAAAAVCACVGVCVCEGVCVCVCEVLPWTRHLPQAAAKAETNLRAQNKLYPGTCPNDGLLHSLCHSVITCATSGGTDSTRSRVAYQAALSAPAIATVQQQQQQQQHTKSKSGCKNFVSVLWRLELFATCFPFVVGVVATTGALVLHVLYSHMPVCGSCIF